jgi:hypothetical protein
MKKILLLSLTTAAFLAACGNNEDTTTDLNNNKDTEVVDPNTTENSVGTRSNPVPVGQTHTVTQAIYDENSDSYKATVDITISDVKRGEEVYKKALEINEFNEAPQEGYEYVAFKVDVTVKDAETQDFALFVSDTDFNFISKDGSPYEYTSVVYEPELSAKVYAGGSTSGYVVGQVKIGEEVQVVYEDAEWKNVFFSIK